MAHITITSGIFKRRCLSVFVGLICAGFAPTSFGEQEILNVRNQSPTYAQIDAFSQPGRNASVSLKYQF